MPACSSCDIIREAPKFDHDLNNSHNTPSCLKDLGIWGEIMGSWGVEKDDKKECFGL